MRNKHRTKICSQKILNIFERDNLNETLGIKPIIRYVVFRLQRSLKDILVHKKNI